MITVCAGAVIGIVLFCCLSLVNSQNQAVARSQSWNVCIPLVEAGLEEAMGHLNNPNETAFNVNGWKQDGNFYSRSRTLGEDFYDVKVDLTDIFKPVIVCTGYVRAPLVIENNKAPLAAANVAVSGVQYIARAVEAVAVKQPRFAKAMVAKRRINMNGNNIETDSFDSSDLNHSTTNGLYDPSKAKDNGDVATTSGGTNIIGVGNANIKGHLQTGPGGTVSIGANGVVGSLDWHLKGNTGIQPGWSSDDMNVAFPDAYAPSTAGAYTPSSGTITGAVFKYVLTGGKYAMSALSLSSQEKMIIAGKTTLIVNGNVDIKGGIDILPGGSLTIYVAGANTTFGGTGINNQGKAGDFVYYGLPSNTCLTLPSNGDFAGAIYAPSADFKMGGGGSTALHFVGACVTKTITVNGIYKFHFDEALGKLGPWGDYVIASWVEL
jgi:hypothetical protein